jgi:hypothetical protein
VKVITPTTGATTSTGEPGSASLGDHFALRKGKIAVITCRDR